MDDTQNSRDREDGSSCLEDIRFKAFLVFGLANFLFISYVAVDHKWEQNDLDNEINEIHEILQRLKEPPPESDCSASKICKEIMSFKSKLERCEKRGKIIEVIQDQMNKKKQYMKIWDSVPKPFIHAEMKIRNRFCEIESGILLYISPSILLFVATFSEALHHGYILNNWNIIQEDVDNCPEVDPIITRGKERIKIQMKGYYYVYSQVTFRCPSRIRKKHHLHEHLTMGGDGNPLMINSYQLCWAGDEGKLKVSYHSGIFKLERNFELFVAVKIPSSTTLYVDDDFHNDDLFFGAYLV